jgi:hypothetical protein
MMGQSIPNKDTLQAAHLDAGVDLSVGRVMHSAAEWESMESFEELVLLTEKAPSKTIGKHLALGCRGTPVGRAHAKRGSTHIQLWAFFLLLKAICIEVPGMCWPTGLDVCC